MFRIGEFSRLCQVSVRMLRYYDETGLLKPSVIDRVTGYRLYSAEQIEALHKIIFLRDTGFNISEIDAALKNWDNSFIIELLEKKQMEVLETIRAHKKRIQKIEIAINDIKEEKISIHYNVLLKSIPAYKVLSLRRVIPNYFHEGLLWKELTRNIESENIEIPQKSLNFAIYHDVEDKDTDVDVEVCVAVNKEYQSSNGFVYREAAEIDNAACIMVNGPFENISAAYKSFVDWLLEHNQYRMTGQNRQICHRGPWNEEDPEKYLIELQIPVEKREKA